MSSSLPLRPRNIYGVGKASRQLFPIPVEKHEGFTCGKGGEGCDVPPQRNGINLHGNMRSAQTRVKVRAVDGKRLEIDGRVYDLEDPEQRKAAVRAWLRAKAESRRPALSGDKDLGKARAAEGGEGGAPSGPP